MEQHPCGRWEQLSHRHHSEGHPWGSLTSSLFLTISSSYQWTIFEIIPSGKEKEEQLANTASSALSQPKGTGISLSDIHVMQYVAQSPKLASRSGNSVDTSKLQRKGLVSWDMNLIRPSGVLHRYSGSTEPTLNCTTVLCQLDRPPGREPAWDIAFLLFELRH